MIKDKNKCTWTIILLSMRITIHNYIHRYLKHFRCTKTQVLIMSTTTKKKNLIRTANEPDMILSGKYDTVGNAHNSLWIKLGQDKEQGIT